MAEDKSLEQIIYGETAPKQPLTGAELNKRYSEEDAVQLKRKEATLPQKTSAFIDEFTKNSWAVEGALKGYKNKLINELAPPDENFKNSDELTQETMRVNGLQMDSYGDLRQSKSLAELQIKATWYKSQTQENKRINETLGDTGRISAAVASAVISPEVAGGVFVGGLYSASAGVAKVAMYEGAFETAIGLTRTLVDDNYTMYDAAIDIPAGIFIATGITKLLHRTRTPDDIRQADGFVSRNPQEPLDPSKPVTPKPEPLDVQTIKTNRETFFKRQKLINEDKTFLETERKLNQEIDTTKVNYTKRSDELVKQEDAINTRIANDTKKLEEIKSKGATARQIKIRENRIAKATKELEDIRVKKVDNDTNYKATQKGQSQRQKDLNTAKGIKSASDIALEKQIDAMSININNTKKQLEDILKGNPDKEFLNEYKQAVEVIAKEFPDEFTGIRDSFRSKLGNKSFTPDSLGGEDWFKKLNKKQKASIIAAGLVTGSTLSASEGGDEFGFGDLLLYAIMGTAAYKLNWKKIYGSIKDANMRSAIKKFKNNVEKSYDDAKTANSPEASAVQNVASLVAETAHTEFLSTVAPFLKKGGDFAKFITDMTYSAQHGAGALELKQRWFTKSIGNYSTSENKFYKTWKLEQQGNQVTAGTPEEILSLQKFREEVTDFIETGKTQSDAVKQMASEVNLIRKHMIDVNKEYGTLGFDKFDFNPNMVSRLWKNTEIFKLLNRISDEDTLKIQSALQRAMEDGGVKNAKELSENFVKHWKRGFNGKPNQAIKSDFNRLQKEGIISKDITIEEYTQAVAGYSDRSARAKMRIDFDIMKFGEEIKGFEVDVDGVNTTLKLNQFVERDIKTILDRTGNTLYGTAALSSRGYKSVRAAEEFIDANLKSDHKLMQQAKQVLQIVEGTPTEITSELMHNLTASARDLTIWAKLPFVALSTPTEIIQTLANGSIFKTVPTLIDGIKNQFGKDSLLMQQLSREFTGFGTSTARLDFGFHGFSDDMLQLDDAGIEGVMRKGTAKMRDAVILGSGLSTITDILQGTNQVLNATSFAKLVHGLDSGINPKRFKSLGLDEDTLAMFNKDMFELNSKGELKPFDMTKWSQKQQDKMTEILFNMNQLVAPETTLGETPLFAHTNDVGKLLTTLISYPIHQFNVHGVQDLRTLDRVGLSHFIGGVVGTYVGLHARYAVQDKEVDNETLIYYSMMNSPQMLGISAVKSMLDPAVISVSSDMAKLVE